MDIEKIRKLSKNASEAGKLVKSVTAYKNELKNREQMRDVIMSDHFKTLREPLIEQQQKPDDKQDKVIEQLKENQLALTSGIQALALPQKTVEDKKDLIANIENRFDEEDRQILDKLGLIQPSELFESDLNDLTKYREDVKKKEKETTHTIVGLKNTKKKMSAKN